MLLVLLGTRWWLLQLPMRIVERGRVLSYSLASKSSLDEVCSNTSVELETIEEDGCYQGDTE